jgi:hypothetical protein
MTMNLPKNTPLLIPGAYDRTTLTYRQPGSIGGAAFGSAMPSGPSSMDATTIAERELEGGGPVRERRRSVTPRVVVAPARLSRSAQTTSSVENAPERYALSNV